MLVYHFTSESAAARIRTEGILPTYIRVPHLGPSIHPVVSLTVNPDPTSLIYKSLWDGSELSGDALLGYRINSPEGKIPRGPNTIARRVHVELPESDTNWYGMRHPDIAALGFVSQEHIDEFVKIGGGDPNEWLVYLGAVPANYIVRIDDPSGELAGSLAGR